MAHKKTTHSTLVNELTEHANNKIHVIKVSTVHMYSPSIGCTHKWMDVKCGCV